MDIQDKRKNLRIATERLKEISNRELSLLLLIPSMIELEDMRGIVDYWTNELARTGERK